MPIFPHIEFEDNVQLNDKIRFDCSKSFVSKDAGTISAMTLKPGDDVAAVSIYSSDVDERYLDWAFSSWKMDIDSTNNELPFSEASTDFTATLSDGTYTLSTLIDEIETQLNAEGANTYTVTVDDNDKITISSDGNFDIVENNLWNQLGFRESSRRTLSSASSYTGLRVRYLTRKLTLTVTNSGGSESINDYVRLYSVDGDALFSSDSDLLPHEPDILKWLPEGKNSYKNIHRRAQQLILAWLDQNGYTDIYQDKFILDAIVDLEEVTEWSKFLSLKLIYAGIKNATDDVFEKKIKLYEAQEVQARSRAILRIDLDGDGMIDKNSQEFVTVSSGSCARR